MQRAYLCVTFHLKHKKLPFFTVLTWFLILSKIQDLGQDGDHCWRHSPLAAPPPIKYTSPCYDGQRLSTESKIVSKYCNILKTLGRGSIQPPPPLPPCTTVVVVVVWICVYVWGLIRNWNVLILNEQSAWLYPSILTNSLKMDYPFQRSCEQPPPEKKKIGESVSVVEGATVHLFLALVWKRPITKISVSSVFNKSEGLNFNLQQEDFRYGKKVVPRESGRNGAYV